MIISLSCCRRDPAAAISSTHFSGVISDIPIVEGPDLTVRAGRVYLKTLEGLKPVELILRRVESNLCDPLELRADSSVGVAGLLQAARENQVVIANAVGSGIVENEAIMSFLPNLSRQVLGEDLQIPSMPDVVVRTSHRTGARARAPR